SRAVEPMSARNEAYLAGLVSLGRFYQAGLLGLNAKQQARQLRTKAGALAIIHQIVAPQIVVLWMQRVPQAAKVQCRQSNAALPRISPSCELYMVQGVQ